MQLRELRAAVHPAEIQSRGGGAAEPAPADFAFGLGAGGAEAGVEGVPGALGGEGLLDELEGEAVALAAEVVADDEVVHFEVRGDGVRGGAHDGPEVRHGLLGEAAGVCGGAGGEIGS